MSNPELSVIIPTLNEAETLPLLLWDLARQEEIALEIIISDGCSTDDTVDKARKFLAPKKIVNKCLTGAAGRGRQMNAGAAEAQAEWLLFIHADSRLSDPFQLCQALSTINYHHRQLNTDALAGRFSLMFETDSNNETLGRYYYETKARLGRPGCIHGDQGFLLKKKFFLELGQFREDLPVMEDTSLAERIRSQGKWVLLPGIIITSARRFTTEGWKPRQTLNALMMNFLAIGWLDFFSGAGDIYQQQDKTQPLRLTPFFRLISRLLKEIPFRRRCKLWLSTGSYVRSQSWQIGLFLDCRKALRQGAESFPRSTKWLKWFDRWVEPLTDHRLGCLLTALLVRVWFAIQMQRKN